MTLIAVLIALCLLIAYGARNIYLELTEEKPLQRWGQGDLYRNWRKERGSSR